MLVAGTASAQITILPLSGFPQVSSLATNDYIVVLISTGGGNYTNRNITATNLMTYLKNNGGFLITTNVVGGTNITIGITNGVVTVNTTPATNAQTPWTSTINAAQFSLTNMSHQVYVNTNLYNGTGTISTVANSHTWTNSGGTFTGLEPGNYLISTNFLGQPEQMQIMRVLSSSVVYTFEPAAQNHTNTTWTYYSNYATLFDSVPRITGYIDGGGGFGTASQVDLANAGYYTLFGGTNSWRIGVNLDGILGNALTFSYSGSESNQPGQNPFNIQSGSLYDTLDVLSNGNVSIRQGLTNLFNVPILTYVPLMPQGVYLTNFASTTGPGTIGVTNGLVKGVGTSFQTTFRTNSLFLIGVDLYRVQYVSNDTVLVADSIATHAAGSVYTVYPDILTGLGVGGVGLNDGPRIAGNGDLLVRGFNTATIRLLEHGADVSAWELTSGLGNFSLNNVASNKQPIYIDKTAGNEFQILSNKIVAMNGFQLPVNTNHAGFVLTTDANGNGSWSNNLAAHLATNSIIITNIAEGTTYTNNSGFIQRYDGTASLIATTVNGLAEIQFRVNGTQITNTISHSSTTTNDNLTLNYTFSIVIPAGGTLAITNLSSGGGNSASVAVNSTTLLTY